MNEIGEVYRDGMGHILGADPTGRYRFRAIHKGKFWTQWVTNELTSPLTRDMKGARKCRPVLTPDLDRLISILPGEEVPKPEARSKSVQSVDAVAMFLEVVGWIGVALSVIGGISLFASAGGSGFQEPDEAARAAAVVVGLLGAIQSLLIVGFGRMINYLSELTSSQRRATALLQQAVDDR